MYKMETEIICVKQPLVVNLYVAALRVLSVFKKTLLFFFFTPPINGKLKKLQQRGEGPLLS